MVLKTPSFRPHFSFNHLKSKYLGLFKNDLEVELAKLDKNVNRRLTSTVTVNDNLPVVHDPATFAPSFLIERLKTLIRQVIRDACKVTGQEVAELLASTDGTLRRRVDVTPLVSKCLQQLTFDFLFILCKYLSHQRVSNNLFN